jgi:hypothetical protein
MENFVKDFKIGLKPGTSAQYLWHIRQYEAFLAEGGSTLEAVGDPAGSVREYLRLKTIGSEKPWSRSMWNTGFYALKRYWEKIRGAPIDKRFFLNTGAETDHEPRILDREELQSIWREGQRTLGPVEELMVHVGWEAALRSGELVTIKGRNFLNDGVIEVRVLKTKNARKRVSLNPETFERVRPLIGSENRPVFRRPVKEGYVRRYTSLEWSSLFGRWTEGFLDGGGIRWHDFARHTRLTHYAEDTRSFLAVLQLSGHQNPRICRQYFERAKIEVPELKAIEAQEWNFIR